jgi:hypothetical protein
MDTPPRAPAQTKHHHHHHPTIQQAIQGAQEEGHGKAVTRPEGHARQGIPQEAEKQDRPPAHAIRGPAPRQGAKALGQAVCVCVCVCVLDNV